MTIYGAGLGPQDLLVASQAAAGTVLPNILGGTTVLFNQIPAPLFYVSAGQVSAIVPYGVTGSTVQVVARVGNATTTPFALPFATSAPGLFTADSSGVGPARAINADGIANNAAHPAIVGSKLTLYVTGEGQTSPPGVDGQPAGATPPQPVLPVAVTIGGKSATVLSAGQIPGGPAGVMQVSVTVPAGLTGQQPVAVTLGNTATQSGITVAVQ